MENISPNTKLEIAVEVIATKIAKVLSAGYTVKEEKMQKLIEERNQMYQGNEQVIDKIIKEFGKEGE